jgi:predicted O-linked N-acetylglucosamine transferase (SPINDLY family)
MDSQLNEAAALQREGRTQEAAARYEHVLRKNPQHQEALYQAATLARQAGKLTQALEYLEAAAVGAPLDSRNYFLRGLILEDLQRPDDAISSLEQAIGVKPDFAEAYNNLGIILHDLKRFGEAIDNFRDAVRINPDYARAYNNLGISLRASGNLADAQQQFAQAVRLNPDYALAHYNLGTGCMDSGQFDQAAIHLSQSIRLKPDYVQAYNNLGHVQRQLGKLDEAETCFRRAAKMKPGKNLAELNSLAQIFWEQGRIEQTVSTYRQAQTLAPHELKAALGAMLSLPAVYGNTEGLLAARGRFREGLQTLHAEAPDFVANNPPKKLLSDLCWSNFYLAYQGLDDKPLAIEYARFIAAMLDKIVPQLMLPRAKKNATGRRMRIGYLSSFFMDCTVGMYFRSWIMRLDRDRFETFVYYTRPETDNITGEIVRGSDHFRHLVAGAGSPERIANAVLEDDLDILIYPELGMDSTSFLLAAMRLAPVQCAGWGHPVTSGHANIDYYLSSAAMEPDNAPVHYTENLVLLDGIGTYYSKPLLPEPVRRADFALPEGKTLYLCPQSLFKIHPDNDTLLARILERDPEGVIVLFAGRHPNITNALFNRLAQALRARGIDPQGRGIILPSISHDDYFRINMLCDVMLDTLHWSGGNTTLDALACNLPVVTLPGEFMRGRQSYGMLKLMGLHELIAKDRDDYVAIAHRLGTDGAWRQQVAQQIADNIGIIFNAETPLRQMEGFFASEFNI